MIGTTIVCWPEIQTYMTKEGFRDNATLLNSPKHLDIYGSSAFQIDNDWLAKADNGELRDLNDEELDALEDDELMVDWGGLEDYEEEDEDFEDDENFD